MGYRMKLQRLFIIVSNKNNEIWEEFYSKGAAGLNLIISSHYLSVLILQLNHQPPILSQHTKF